MKCPNCGGMIYSIDTLDSEWDGNSYFDIVEGTCSECYKVWRWEEVYTLTNIQNVREIDPNDHL